MSSPARASSRGVAPVLFAALVAALLLAVGAAAGAFGGHALRRAQQPLPPRVVAAGRPTPSVLGAATASPAAVASATTSTPAAADVAAALAGPLADPRLGGHTLVDVLDAPTGTSLYAADPATPAPPASTTKLTTAAAVLTVHAATDRITTTVVAGATPGAVVLVGAGDPTLSAAPAGTPTPYAGAARIADLAAAVTTSSAGVAVTSVTVDDGLFPGPATATGWAAEDAPSEYAAPVTAALIDGGREAPDAPGRSGSPDLAAGRALAAALGAPDAPVSVGTAPAGTTVLGSVQSAPIGTIVEEMLQQSDNVLAECLARQVALAVGEPASFDGAAAAVRQVLPEVGTGLVDGSGLSADDRLAPSALTAVLSRIDDVDRLRQIDLMLPIAGWDGSLAGRFLATPASEAAGLVRAKTGTLTGVSTLAGFATTRSGHLLIFALLADRVPPTYQGTLDAEAALDDVAAALTQLP